MTNSRKAALLKYGISGAIAAAMFGVYVGTRDFGSLDLMNKYLVLCDGLTIPGVIFLMLGCLMWISNEGGLDILAFAVSKAASFFIPGGGDVSGESYYDYVQRKRENRVRGYGFLFVVGGICMAFAMLFMYLFYRLYK